jgi:hypothetical protein
MSTKTFRSRFAALCSQLVCVIHASLGAQASKAWCTSSAMPMLMMLVACACVLRAPVAACGALSAPCTRRSLNFCRSLKLLCEQMRGIKFKLRDLKRVVEEHGGFDECSAAKHWAQVVRLVCASCMLLLLALHRRVRA